MAQLQRLGRQSGGHPAQVQVAGPGEIVAVKVGGGKMAGGGAFAEILHTGIGTIGIFRFQLKTGWIAAINGDPLGINSFFRQLLQGKAAKRVVTYPADPADVQTQAGQPDSHVQFGTGDAFGKAFNLGQIASLRCDKHRHGFTQRDDI
ncbi:hypothetical protein D3C80_948600 [compost metagenome]